MDYKYFPLSSIFSEIDKGDVHSASELGYGNVPLVSCKTDKSKNYGIEGFFDIPKESTYSDCVTITCDGEPCTAAYRDYRIAAKDNVLVCRPKQGIKLSTILYAVAYLNTQRWRFSYGRKCYENKLDKLKICFPVKDGEINHVFIDEHIDDRFNRFFPLDNKIKQTKIDTTFKTWNITQLFKILRGDFHSLSELDEGIIPTVSRTSHNNGIVGLYGPPDNAALYPAGTLTVSTVSGEVYLQVVEFMATDNILILQPKQDMDLTILVFIQIMLNMQTWRFSYGRQCYRTKFLQTRLDLPTLDNEELDKESMKKMVENTTYFQYVKSHIDQKMTPPPR